MARMDMGEAVLAPLGQAPISAEMFFDLGLMYASGRSGEVDLISAHKWFNLAAMRGYTEAVPLRREIAEQMSAPQVEEAQRAARDWLKTH